MKSIYKLSLLACLGGLSLTTQAQTSYNAGLLMENQLNGTARFMGMGGAMSALGADLSTLATNPAGIGLYRSNDVAFSLGWFQPTAKAEFNGESTDTKHSKFSFDQIGFVYSSKVGNRTAIRFLNFGFNYRKVKNFNSDFDMIGPMPSGNSYSHNIRANLQAAGNTPEDFDNVLNSNNPLANTNYSWLSILAGETGYVSPGQDNKDFDTWGADYIGFHSENRGGINAVGGFDRELELSLTYHRIHITYLQNTTVLDEKVQYSKNFSNQRRRWLSAQWHYFTTFADDHYISLLGGAEIRGQYSKSIYEKRYGYDPVSGNSAMPVFPEGDKLEYGDMLSYASIMDGLSGQSILEDAFASFYFSLDYVLKERYILSLTARTDGSNNFGSDEQFNPTGSLGLGWNISQEPFMEPLKPILSSLSLRAAFGYTGNINKSVYPQLVMDYESSFRRTDFENFRIGSIKNAPNPNLRWEKTRDMKLGLEIGFFDDRLRLSGEIYDRRTSDAVTSDMELNFPK